MVEIIKNSDMQASYKLDDLNAALLNIRENGFKIVSTKVSFDEKKVIITVKEAA